MKDVRRVAFRFGKFLLDEDERVLLLDGRPVTLTPKAFDILVVLVRNSGHLITKDELLNQVWPDAVVAEVNLSVNISALRKIFGENGFIETVPKRGYRFVAPVETITGENLDVLTRRRLSAVIPVREKTLRKSMTLLSEIARHKQLTISLGLILLIGAAFWLAKSRPTHPVIDSIAVLPFSSNDAVNNYLAEGLSESVTNGLSRVTKLHVAPRTNVLRYKTQSVSPQQAGRELSVAAILNGQVAQKEDVLTIRVDLIDVRGNAEIFTSEYTGKPSELISLQTRILQDVSRALNVPLTEDDQRLLTHGITENADAYRVYLEGRYFWNQRSESGIKKAIEGFERATKIDSNFALAYSGLADSYTTLGYLSYISPTQAFPVAKNYALKAIELDPTLSEPHASLAYDKFYFDWDWPGAENEFRRAIDLNPNYATAHQWYSVFLLAAGRPNEAFREIYLARQCDPLSLSINTDIGFHHYYNKQYEEAIKQLTGVLEMRKDFALAHLWLGRSYQQLGRYQEALAEFRLVEGAFSGWAVSKAALGYVEGVSGDHREAAKTLTELEALSKQRFITAYGVALVHAGMGDKDKAFEWLNKAFDERSHWLVWLRLDPRWDVLRSDPRFNELVSRMHLQ